jgi:hypothetical protein
MRRTYLTRTTVLLALAVLVAGLVVVGLAFHASDPSVLAKSEEKDNGRRCTLHSAKGAYGFALVGSLAAVGAIATSGTTNFDGEGNDSGKFAVTTFGTTQQFTFTGVYTVNKDCTGTATLSMSPSVFGYSVLHFDAVGTNEEKDIKWLITDPGIVIAGTLTEQ